MGRPPKIRETREWRQVYFIEAEGLNMVKIGCADRVMRRLAELQTGCPVKLKVRGVYHTDDASGLEARFHRTYAHLRTHGEWFRMDDDLAYMSLGSGVVDEDDPTLRMVRFPERHDPAHPSVTVHYVPGESEEDFMARSWKVCRALHPDIFIEDVEAA